MRIVFIGTGEIGVPTMRALLQTSKHEIVGVVTQPDKPAGRAQELRPSPIKLASSERGIPLLQPPRVKAPEVTEQIRAWSSDVIVVMAYGQILPRSILEIPSVACLNLHASLLPRHRGAAPIQAAILSGDRRTGMTVIYMSEGLDTGDILLQESIEISPNETGGSLSDLLSELAPVALSRALDLLESKNAPRRAQNSEEATYAPKLERADGRIDWSQSAVEIERKIRAFDPWPGTFTEIRAGANRARHLKVFRAALVQGTGKPGELIRDGGADLVVCAGEAALSLGEVQLEGKRRMAATEFLRGSPGPFTIAD